MVGRGSKYYAIKTSVGNLGGTNGLFWKYLEIDLVVIVVLTIAPSTDVSHKNLFLVSWGGGVVSVPV